MIKLYNKDTGAFLANITEAQLKFLADHLEEESATDRDYYLRRDTLATFEQAGADATLVEILRKAIGEGNDVEVRWARE